MLLIFLSPVTFANAQLLIITDKDESEFGYPIHVKIVAISSKLNLKDINLEELNKAFGITTNSYIDEADDTRWPNKYVQKLNIKIYPRHQGLITFPTLTLGRLKSEEKNINITTNKSSKVVQTASTTTPFQREQFSVKISMLSDTASSRLITTDINTDTRFNIKALKFSRIKQDDGLYLLQIGWAITTPYFGKQALDLPVVNYSVSGVTIKKIYPLTQSYIIKKLPAYIPPTMSIGKVSLLSKVERSISLKTNVINTGD